MEADAFLAELYRRMSLRQGSDDQAVAWEDVRQQSMVQRARTKYRDLLPTDREARILDIGFGNGWFLAACLELGYQNVSGAEFGGRKAWIESWSPAIRTIYSIDTSITDFLAEHQETFDFIHLSHVIEHIPRYNLLETGDALYQALRPGGTLFVRTPNMEGPCANSAYFVTLGHEQGFSGSNLMQWFEVCRFDAVEFVDFPHVGGFRQRVGRWVRQPLLAWQAFKHRWFGANRGGRFGTELVIRGQRSASPPFEL